MASVETSGPTVDDAIDAALEKLDLDEDQVDLEILSEGGDGQPARVRATPRAEVDAALERGVPLSEEAGEIEWDESLATAGREIVGTKLDMKLKLLVDGAIDVLSIDERRKERSHASDNADHDSS